MKQLYKLILFLLLFLGLNACNKQKEVSDQPNILWITIEDLTPMLGCYGDPVAVTPTIDKLAANGVKYTNAFATAAVCSPARSALITGVYATTLGTQHLRSETKVPELIKPLPKYLRESGYYCSNNGKEDYNFELNDVWNESSKKAHWRNRNPGQSFFAVFNFETTHQSRIFGSDSIYSKRFEKYIPQIERTNPGDIQLPSYFFDAPQIRKLWARYYDNVQIVDLQIAELLAQLEADELIDNTIIFFYSDHGTGMPRGKRALYDSGLKVPLIIVAPEKYQKRYHLEPGETSDRLVSFVDFAPTMLNMLDINIPEFMQGLPFLGSYSDKENKLVFATSDRVDEAYEAVRSVRTENFRYVRNFLPHLPLIQPNYYSDQSEIMKEVYAALHSDKPMTEDQKSMWLAKRPVEELYEISNDPDETNNLADVPKYQHMLKKLRQENMNVMLKTNDSGLAPEAYMYEISKGTTPYEKLMDKSLYPMERILQFQDKLYNSEVSNEEIMGYLSAPNPLTVYWTMIWLQSQDHLDLTIAEHLIQILDQPESFVTITAAEILCQFGYIDQALPVLSQAMQTDNPYLLLMAARAFELLGEKASPAHDEVKVAWLRLKEEVKDKWKGYDLYASWALNEVFEK